jgi:hypothetical protein
MAFKRTISINRPHGDPVHLKAKGQPTLHEDGSVVGRFKNDRGHTYWIGISADTLREMVSKLPTLTAPLQVRDSNPGEQHD